MVYALAMPESDTTKFSQYSTVAWAAVVTVTLGLFFGTLLLQGKKR
jgi:hypothetical protein